MVLALSQAGQRAAALGVAAGVALAVWFAFLGVLAWATRPDLPDPAPSTSEFGGRERPAVVNFLVNRWEVGREAVPATLLDLAARGVVGVEQVAPERFVVRLRGQAAGTAGAAELAPYEQQVLDHVRKLASDGVVACEALTTGPQDESSGWWDRFRKAVVADARKEGLSRARWAHGLLVALGVTAIAPALLVAATFVAIPSDKSSSSSDDDPVGAFLGVGALAWGMLMSVPYALRAERDTAKGTQAAARWLGLKEYLGDDQAFDQAPPAAVAMWDRYLSYGAAMGVAAGAVRALPLGAESDTEAWSAYGGRWHVVRVRYPVRIPPGYGQHPLKVAAKGALFLLMLAGIVRIIGPPLADVAGDVWDRLAQGVQLGVLVTAGVLLASFTVFAVRSAAMFLCGVIDLSAKVEVEGLVVRLRNGYLAVDDGRAPRVRAWRVEAAKLNGVTRGSVVRATVSRWLGYVWRLEPVAAQPQQAGLGELL